MYILNLRSTAMKKIFVFTILIGINLLVNAQGQTKYPDIPRIDVHTHPANDYIAIKNYLMLREVLKEKYAVDFAFG